MLPRLRAAFERIAEARPDTRAATVAREYGLSAAPDIRAMSGGRGATAPLDAAVVATPEPARTLRTHREPLIPKARVLARKVIAKVVRELKRTKPVQVEPAIAGAQRRDPHPPRRAFRSLDLSTTRRNFDRGSGKRPVNLWSSFAAGGKKKPWQAIVAAAQSGPMMEGAISSAVGPSIFAVMTAIKASPIPFDTPRVDLSGRIGQPVAGVIRTQLGRRTDLAPGLLNPAGAPGEGRQAGHRRGDHRRRHREWFSMVARRRARARSIAASGRRRKS